MTPADRDELRARAADRATVGCRTSFLIIGLLDDLEEKEAELARKGDLIRGLCARVEAQAELLRKRAEKPDHWARGEALAELLRRERGRCAAECDALASAVPMRGGFVYLCEAYEKAADAIRGLQ